MEEDDLIVQLAPTGEHTGSDQDGNGVSEILTEDSLRRVADRVNATGKPVLVDQDHRSTLSGAQKDTRAVGWLSRLFATAKGLFGHLSLTPHGKTLVEGREYTALSPVFTLDEEGRPVDMPSVGATNTPALEGTAILNSKPTDEDTMSKQEIIELIKETVAAMKAEEAAAADAANTCGEKEQDVKNEQPVEEPKVEEPKAEEPKAEEPKAEEPKAEEPKAEEPVEVPAVQPVEEKEEVIKVEALNSMPVAPSLDKAEAWSKLSGKAFWDYLAKHPECR